MLADFLRALRALEDYRIRRVLLAGVLLSAVLLVATGFLAQLLVTWLSATGYLWLDRVIDALGALATVLLAWFLFPSIAIAVLGLFLERVVGLTEQRFLPHLAPAHGTPLASSLVAAARLLALSLLLNIAALPIYIFLPIINLPLWYALNGYLVGREYIELVAQRRMDPAAVQSFRKRTRLSWWPPGALVAVLLTIPLVNLAAPVFGAAFMTLRFHRMLERDASAS